MQNHIFETLLTVTDEDFLTVIGYKPGYPHKLVENWRMRFYQELKNRYGIRDKTCMDTLLEYFVSNTEPPHEKRIVPYKLFLKEMGQKGWSESSIRKGVKKMQELGVADVLEIDKKTSQLIKEVLWKKSKNPPPKGKYRHLVESLLHILTKQFSRAQKRYMEIGSNISIPKSIMNFFDVSELFPDSFIHGMSQEEIDSLDKEVYRIIENIDLRGLGTDQRSKILLQTYRKHYKKGESRTDPIDRKQRMKIVDETIEKLRALPNVSRIFKIGSLADWSFTKVSDSDLMVVTRNVSGKKEVDEIRKNFHKSIELFLFTERDYKGLIENKKLIALSAVPVFER